MGHGVPYHHYLSAQVTKDQRLLAGRSEATLYHDPLGAATTSLSADVQTSAAGGGPGGDVLLVLRSDTRLKCVSGWWLGLVAMALPLGRLAWGLAADAVRRARARRRMRKLQQQQQQQQQQQAAQQAAAAAKQGQGQGQPKVAAAAAASKK
ncbi:hypothetical protein GPECTOR_65g192 [Gonium pectorale]|uniref:Uncharacterized protein n=1 Tax=Gonium pectorale TaxID=33097 RepID=A0A150G419_GONPE|nr:hypothetical protein GPECTOR_65g192 [Gonium pectorale]|eukprot:KXZ44574.1 hypothetical protein GPECTOR_65g192 [Gonium pectorale]